MDLRLNQFKHKSIDLIIKKLNFKTIYFNFKLCILYGLRTIYFNLKLCIFMKKLHKVLLFHYASR